MTRVTIATFHDAAKAEPLRERLEQAGIHAEINDESKLEKLWCVSKGLADIRLQVDSNNFDKAVALLHEWEKDGALRDAVCCPECRSPRVEYPQFTRKFFIPNLIGLLANLGFVEKEFYCEDCHFTWPKQGAKPRPKRPHMAPYYFIEGIEQLSPAADSGTAEPSRVQT